MNYLLLIKDYFYRRNHPAPQVLSIKQTINFIIEHKCSVSRFGDGEIDLILKINQPKFQHANNNLTRKLKEALNGSGDKYLVCFPKCFSPSDLSYMTHKARHHWTKFIIKNRANIYSILPPNTVFGNALFTRNYIDIFDKQRVKDYFTTVKQIWTNRNVIIVEGAYTRFGVGNNLLDNAASVSRILCPATNAFDKYQDILSTTTGIEDKNALFLLALGPTATVLAYDLSQTGYQAIDIGHLDIEYEWFLAHAKEKQKVSNKYVNETDDIISSSNDTLHDKKYESQILKKIL